MLITRDAIRETEAKNVHNSIKATRKREQLDYSSMQSITGSESLTLTGGQEDQEHHETGDVDSAAHHCVFYKVSK